MRRLWVCLIGAAITAVACADNDSDAMLSDVRAGIATQTYACGAERCAPHRQYCLVTTVSAGQPMYERWLYSCEPLPMECLSKPTCACLELPNCLSNRGNLTVATDL